MKLTKPAHAFFVWHYAPAPSDARFRHQGNKELGLVFLGASKMPDKTYYARHKEQGKAYSHAYRAAHRVECMDHDRAYYSAHKEEITERARVQYATHREQAKARSRAYNLAHKEQKAAHDRAYRATHKEQRAAQTRRYLYGLSLANYEALLEKQGGRCAICGQSNGSGRRLHVDHNHTTGEVRALICHNCNTGLGLAGESPALCRQWAAYLEQH